MSRSHRKRKPPAPTESAALEQSDAPIPSLESVSRLPALVVAIATLAWYALLIGMAAFDHRPVVVNLVQIDDAEFVVIATSKDPQTLNVQRVLKGEHSGEVIRLADPLEPAEEAFVFPLRRKDDVLQIVRCEFRTAPQLIYPATDDVVRQVEDAIENPVPRLMQVRP